MAFSAKNLIEKHVAATGTFRIPTSDNPEEDLIVKTVSGVNDMTTVTNEAVKLQKIWDKGNAPPSWKPYGPVTKEVATIVAELILLVEEPKFSTVEALQLCKEAGVFASFIHAKIMERLMQDVPMQEVDAIEDLKNDLGPMSSDETTSSSAETT